MWIIPLEADVFGRLSAPEVAALQTKVLGPNQTDPIPDEIVRVCELIRGFVAANPQNLPMASGISIPSKLLDCALSLITYRAASRLPTKIMLTEARIAANREAMALLHDVAAYPPRFRIDRPDPQQLDKVENIGNIYGSLSTLGRRPKFRDERGI